MEIIEKVAYLKGLAEGLGLNDSTKEGKVLGLVIDLLDDVALALSDMGESFAMLSEQVESMDDDLDEILTDIYEDDEDDDEDDEGHIHGRIHESHGGSECCGRHGGGAKEAFEGELYEVVCPVCEDIICVDEDMLDSGEINCPGCGELLEFDLGGVLDCDEKNGDEEDK